MNEAALIAGAIGAELRLLDPVVRRDREVGAVARLFHQGTQI